MKKISLFFITLLVVISCQKKESNVDNRDKKKDSCTSKKSEKGKDFEMYSMSEMAALMEQMYVDNQRLKERIEKGEAVGKFPDYFLKIHSAKFTDESDNDDFFKENATLFINAQKLIYNDPKNAKKHFNEGINACITCHESKCGGPIPKIKKLYIK
ncbi:hypothetical protein [Flavobacterium sp.]|uniref:hypothetical protein n=1 Tax=Flavobacterium sp. TaxID=239 RepID=UPI00286D9646|nr:hypothetical protein [Flavobacterium sp.]